MGRNSATGLPFLVIRTGSPVRATSSISARHWALNSEALTICMTASTHDVTTAVTTIMTMVVYMVKLDSMETDVEK